MGDRQVRNAGTACMETAALCLDAVLALRSSGGVEWTVPSSKFVAYTAGADGCGPELLVEIRLPQEEPGAASAYKKAPRSAGGPPLAGVAASIEVDAEGLCRGARLAVGSLAQSARLLEDAAALLCGGVIEAAGAGATAAAANLLEDNTNPSEAEVRQALAGNLCRCGAYGHIVVAVLAATAWRHGLKPPPPKALAVGGSD